jgi:hypothetical protein
MRKGIVALGLLVLGGVGWAQAPPAPAPQDVTPGALRAELEALKPRDHVWRAIAWKTCPLEALKAARAQKKPVIVWVFLGLPTDERC